LTLYLEFAVHNRKNNTSGDNQAEKFFSGGQAGTDRAALDAAIKFTIHGGGWVPGSCSAEDGPFPVPISDKCKFSLDKTLLFDRIEQKWLN